MNSHIIVEEHVGAPREAHPGGPEIAVFSAMNAAALTRLVARMRAYVATHPELPLADIAYTLQVGRNALPCRLAVVAASPNDLLAKLDAFSATPGAGEGIWYTPSTLDCAPRTDAKRVKSDTAARALESVAACWADGIAIDWDALHAGRRPHRISLPGYPFDEVRCWYSEFADAPSVLSPLASRKAPPEVEVERPHLKLTALASASPQRGEVRETAAFLSPLPEGEVDARAIARAAGEGLIGQSLTLRPTRPCATS